ncbi:MAG: transcriptional regulator [Clostridioides sp.]|nr:transcriptional regulator [Clostridioides sp.]
MIIGVIGAEDSCIKIKKCLQEVEPQLIIKLYILERTEKLLEVMNECDRNCDVFIFTGFEVCELVKKEFDLGKPYSTVKRGSFSLIKALWEVKDLGKDFDKFSIDTIEEQEVIDTLKELKIDRNRVYMRTDTNISIEEYANWHISLYKNKKIDIIFTGIDDVYNYLKKLGYPVFSIEATVPSIKNSYNYIKHRYKLNRAKNSQLALEILRFTKKKKETEQYYSDMMKLSEIELKIIEYIKEINGSIFRFGSREYVIFLNKGVAESDKNYRVLFDLKKYTESVGFILYAGIGIGYTAYQAESNAYNSLKKSEESKGNDIYLIDEKENLKGPLKSEKELHYSLISKDEKILEICKKTKVRFEYIARIISINNIKQNKIYDSRELADYLNMSERSASRIINKLVDGGYARVYDKKSDNCVGRPRILFEMKF